MQDVLMSRLLVTASGAQSHWGALGELAHLRDKETMIFIYKPLFVIGCGLLLEVSPPHTSGLCASFSHG